MRNKVGNANVPVRSGRIGDFIWSGLGGGIGAGPGDMDTWGS